MEGSVASSSKLRRAPAPGKGKNRKYWSQAEEEACITAVKFLIVDGWKSRNGWRPGFYKQVAARIRNQISTSEIRGEPHVLSKITVWKKDYNLLRGLFGKSGAEALDPIDHTITNVGSEAWVAACKLNPDLEKLENKPFPYFEHWKEMFGLDRANGDAAHDLGSTVIEILENENAEQGQNRNTIDDLLGQQTPVGVDEDDALSGARTPANSTYSMYPPSKKRRLRVDIDEDPFTKMAIAYMADTKEGLERLCRAISSLKEVDPGVSKVFNELEQLPEFSTDERIVAAKEIVASPTGVALFFSLSKDAKVSYVRRALRSAT